MLRPDWTLAILALPAACALRPVAVLRPVAALRPARALSMQEPDATLVAENANLRFENAKLKAEVERLLEASDARVTKSARYFSP